MALMLEGVELLDSLLAMVDHAAEERAVRALAQTAPAPAPIRPRRSASAAAEPTTAPLLDLGPVPAATTGALPNGLDAGAVQNHV